MVSRCFRSIFCSAFLLIALFSPVFLQSEEKKSDPPPNWNYTDDRKTAFGDEVSTARGLEREKRKKTIDFFVFGGTFGSPAGLNFLGAYYFKDLVLRGSGMRWDGNWWGGQLDLGYSFWKTPVIAHSISVVTGTFGVNPYAPEGGRGGQRYYPSGVDFPGYDRNPPSYSDLLIRSQVQSFNSNLDLILQYESRKNQNQYLTQRYIGLTYDLLIGNAFLQFGGGVGSGDYRNPILLIQFGAVFDTRGTSE